MEITVRHKYRRHASTEQLVTGNSYPYIGECYSRDFIKLYYVSSLQYMYLYVEYSTMRL